MAEPRTSKAVRLDLVSDADKAALKGARVIHIGPSARYQIIGANGATLSGIMATQAQAEARLDDLKRAAQRRRRPCMCCRTSFLSDGPHNRLCNVCRQRDGEDWVTFGSQGGYRRGHK
ncbi:hypothetical protein [Tropicibacter sp. S64]|uniref:hypothetical protein n=1 Tax=Tropicibacter sp. S64 TaxID=3415122 RepID=UPI003C7B1D8E